MRNELKAEIKRLSKKAFDKRRQKLETTEKFREKFRKRTGITPPAVTSPTFAPLNRHFDPAHCKRHANVIATAIWHRILTFEYQPEPALHFEIDKPDGSKRGVTAFGIPDAALANVLLRRTLSRNRKRLSPHSYAYNPDRNVFDAILALRDFDKDGKLFAVQIDFKKYFDTIPARYLKKKISDPSIVSLTPHERYIYEAFLHHRTGDRDQHISGSFGIRVGGTPQGSSASLFLANLANHELDRKLSAESGKFVRFADDVVAICSSYEGAQKLERCFETHCGESGLIINRKKSPGIAILSDYANELRTVKDFTYLGYQFQEHGLGLPEKTAQKLRQKISRLVNIYLIQALNHGFNTSRSSRAGQFDWDLLGLIYEIRRGFYGGLREQEIRQFLDGGGELRSMRGLMGFYCLLQDPSRLRQLDGWTVNVVRRASKVRNEILGSRYGRDCPTPSNRELILGNWLSSSAWNGDDEFEEVEVGFPSLVRGWRAARKHFLTFGLEGVQPPGYDSSFDVSLLFESFSF